MAGCGNSRLTEEMFEDGETLLFACALCFISNLLNVLYI